MRLAPFLAFVRANRGTLAFSGAPLLPGIRAWLPPPRDFDFGKHTPRIPIVEQYDLVDMDAFCNTRFALAVVLQDASVSTSIKKRRHEF